MILSSLNLGDCTAAERSVDQSRTVRQPESHAMPNPPLIQRAHNSGGYVDGCLIAAQRLNGLSENESRQKPTMQQTKRIDEIDFWRGVALVVIFINHFQGNVVSYITPRNYGFSDSAEAFVFISGMSVTLAYRRYFFDKNHIGGISKIFQRASLLYVVHICLTLTAIILYWAGSNIMNIPDIIKVDGRGAMFSSPGEAVIGVVGLTHQLGYFNILPIYIIFMLISPVILISGVRSRWLMLAGSCFVYLTARYQNINAPSWPEEGFWYFNPFTWQLLFTLGVFFGLDNTNIILKANRLLYYTSMLFTVIAALMVSNFFGLIPGYIETFDGFLDWDKTQLGVVRIIDFLALAYLIYASGVTARLRGAKFYSAAEMLGRNGLLVFCVASLLSAAGTIIKEAYALTAIFDFIFVTSGVKILHAVAGAYEAMESKRY